MIYAFRPLSNPFVPQPFPSPRLAAVVTAVTLTAVAWTLDRANERRLLAQHRSDTALQLELFANGISRMVSQRLERVAAVAAFVESATSLDFIDKRFPVFAERMFRDGAGIRSIELQRNGRIDWVFPTEQNEEVLHKDAGALFGPQVKAQIESTLASDRITITGPTATRQQGVGIVARKAIRSSITGAPDLVSIVVHLDSIFGVASKDSGIESLDISVVDPAGKVVSQLGTARPEDPVRTVILVPGGAWAVIGAPRGGWSHAIAPSVVPVRIGLIVIVLLVTALVFNSRSERQRLELAVKLRTEQIDANNKLLEAKNAELERFTYTVSHDLKSPLITIRAYLEQLKRSVAEGDLGRFDEDAERIRNASNRMEALLRDLLALSRVGHVLNRDAAVAMADVVQDAADMVRGSLLQCGARLEVADALPEVLGDRARLAEVLQNLIENAIKFARGDTTPLIRIGVRREPEGNVFFVGDNGVGIDPRHHDKVFGLFEKLNPQSEGTGVGLALVRRIIDAHGGRVWVESDGLGQGSTFCFTVPRQIVESSHPPPGPP